MTLLVIHINGNIVINPVLVKGVSYHICVYFSKEILSEKGTDDVVSAFVVCVQRDR